MRHLRFGLLVFAIAVWAHLCNGATRYAVASGGSTSTIAPCDTQTPCTLDTAVLFAAPDDVISIGDGNYFFGLTLTRSVTLQGTGVNATWSCGGGKFIFYVAPSVSITVRNLTFGICDASGNGVLPVGVNGGAITLGDGASAVFTQCTIALVSGAPAVMAAPSALPVSLSFKGCTFYQNIFGGTGTNYEGGGAIRFIAAGTASSLVISNCEFLSNAAYGENGSPAARSGGAIMFTGSGAAQLVISSTLFRDNKAIINTGNGSCFPCASGGALYISLTSSSAAVTIVDTKFSGSIARDYGGGMFFVSAGASQLTTILFERNQARNGAGLFAGSGIGVTPNIIGQGLTFRGNSASDAGALTMGFNTNGSGRTTFQCGNCAFYNNSAGTVYGAAISFGFGMVNGDLLSMSSASFCGNLMGGTTQASYADFSSSTAPPGTSLSFSSFGTGSQFACYGVSNTFASVPIDGQVDCSSLYRNTHLGPCQVLLTAADTVVVGLASLSIPKPTTTYTSVVNITGNVVVPGNLQITPGSVIVINPSSTLTVIGTVTIQPGAGVVVVVGPNATSGPNTINVVTASSISGAFGAANATVTVPCNVVTGVGLSYQPTVISAIVQIDTSQCNGGGGGGSAGGLSPGQIAGIVVGTIVGGVLLGLLAVYISVYLMRKRDKKLAKELRQMDFNNMNRQPSEVIGGNDVQ